MTLSILFAIAALFQQPATGTIRGRVTVAGSGQPVANARIETSPPVITDGEGMFEIKNLPAGNVSIRVFAPGYVPQRASVRLVGEQPVTLNVALTPMAAVSGRLTDEFGRPFTGIEVQILKPVYDKDGRRSLQNVRFAHSDDRGIYRIYWIPPGRYYVAAGFGDEPRRTANEVRGERVPGVYYPSALEPAQASLIEVKPAAELIGIDFSFRRLHEYSISGRVLDATTGAPPVSRDVSVRVGNSSGQGRTTGCGDLGLSAAVDLLRQGQEKAGCGRECPDRRSRRLPPLLDNTGEVLRGSQCKGI
jgi:hypothetical protein